MFLHAYAYTEYPRDELSWDEIVGHMFDELYYEQAQYELDNPGVQPIPAKFDRFELPPIEVQERFFTN